MKKNFEWLIVQDNYEYIFSWYAIIALIINAIIFFIIGYFWNK